MSRLLWDEVGKRFFETGLDRGVLYLTPTQAVPWNGLTAVDDDVSSIVNEPLFIDGVKYLDRQELGDFAATMTAITYPREFEELEGDLELAPGLSVSDQNPGRFSLSYRTLIGNDLSGTDHAYRIHILYNLTATVSPKNYKTAGADATPMELSWDLSAVPEPILGYRPTAHVILDTTELNRFQVEYLEDILYGNETTEPRLPPLQELATLITSWALIVITDHGDGTWSATGPDDLITLHGDESFTIEEANAVYTDEDTYQISNTD